MGRGAAAPGNSGESGMPQAVTLDAKEFMVDFQHFQGGVETSTTVVKGKTTLQSMRHEGGLFWNLDEDVWENTLNEIIKTEEVTGKKYITRRLVYQGIEFNVYYLTPFYDERLPDFLPKMTLIDTDEKFQELILDQPWDLAMWQRRCSLQQEAKLRSGDLKLMLEGAHGIWELTVEKAHHAVIGDSVLESLIVGLKSRVREICICCAAAVWELARTTAPRRILIEAGVVEELREMIMLSEERIDPKPEGEEYDPTSNLNTLEVRARLQTYGVGALGVLMVDHFARRHILEQESDLRTVVALATRNASNNLEEDKEAKWLAEDMPPYLPYKTGLDYDKLRRKQTTAAETLASILVRDADGRLQFAEAKGIQAMMPMFESPITRIRFCAAMSLSLFARDAEGPITVALAGASELVFTALIELMDWCLNVLREGAVKTVGREDAHMILPMTEASANGLWGAAMSCLSEAGSGVNDDMLRSLARVANECYDLNAGLAPHAMAGTMCCLARDRKAAEHIMALAKARDSNILQGIGPRAAMAKMLIGPSLRTVNPVLKGRRAQIDMIMEGKVRACAAATCGNLAVHDLDSTGEEALTGPFRHKLVAGTMIQRLLESLQEVPVDEKAQADLLQAGAAAVMQLCTVVEEMPEHEMDLFLEVLDIARGLESSVMTAVMQFLMPSLWLLLRNSHNRKYFVSAAPVPSKASRASMASGRGPAAGSEEGSRPGTPDSRTEGEEAAAAAEAEGAEESPGGEDPAPAAPSPSPTPPGEPPAEGDGIPAPEEGAVVEVEVEPPAELKGRCLDVLDTVGITNLNLLKEAVDENDPVVQMYTYWVAALWIFMVAEDDTLWMQEDVYELRENSWYTVPQLNPDTLAERPELTLEAVELLVQLMQLPGEVHWKIRELAIGLAWNVTARDIALQSKMVEVGVAHVLLEVVADAELPISLRHISCAFFMFLGESAHNVKKMQGRQLQVHAMLHACTSDVPALEEIGTRGLAHIASQPGEKLAIAEMGVADVMMDLVQRPHTEHDVLLNALLCLQNLSLNSEVQVMIAKRGLYTLLRVNNTTEHGDLKHVSSCILQNCALNAANRTRMYKAELRLKKQDEMPLPPMAEGGGGVKLPPIPGAEGTSRGGGEDDVKHRFLKWVDTTFSSALEESQGAFMEGGAFPGEGGDGEHGHGGTSGGRTLRRREPLYRTPNDSNGGMSDKAHGTFSALSGRAPVIGPPMYEDSSSRREPIPRLVHSLRKPASGIWAALPKETLHHSDPGLGHKYGKARWNPHIQEYVQPPAMKKLPGVADKLLVLKRPDSALKRLTAAAEEVAGAAASDQLRFNGGRQTRPMNALAVTPEVTPDMPLTLMLPDDQRFLSPRTMRMANRSGGMAPAGGTAREEDAPTGHPLNVVVAPMCPRNVVSFEDSTISNPRMCVFEHVDGCSVCQGLYRHYMLPNGKMGHYYDVGSGLVDEVDLPLDDPPTRPLTLEAIMQVKLPWARVLQDLCRPSAADFPISFKPVPMLCPDPFSHTLDVKDPPAFFGDLRENRMQFNIEEHTVEKEEIRNEEENLVVKEPWTLPKSVFAPRAKGPESCDAKDFYDTQKVTDRMFEMDWNRVVKQERFVSFVDRENKKEKEDVSTTQEELDQIRDVLKVEYSWMEMTFRYFASQGSGGEFGMQLNEYTDFLDTCNIPDSESAKCKRSDCDTLFIVANFEEDWEKEASNKVANEDNSLIRYEFLEVLIRVAVAKYGNGIRTFDISECVSILVKENILPNIPPEGKADRNTFRRERLYFEEMDILYKKHLDLIKILYKCYVLRPREGGRRPKLMKLWMFMEFINEVKLVDDDFTLREAKLAYLNSQMVVADEVKDWLRNESITFVDFLEVLGRLADLKSLPSPEDLKTVGVDNVRSYYEVTAQQPELRVRRESSDFTARPTRPLWDKVAILLEYIFRMLDWGPEENYTYSTSNLLKALKKREAKLGS